MRAERMTAVLLAVVGVAITGAASFGGRTSHARFNFGPGDGPFVQGFAPEVDVEDKVGWHWTTYDSTVALPLVARDADVSLTLRYARMFPEEAVVSASLAGVPAASWTARGGEIRETEIAARRFSGPLDLRMRADSHERRNMGLRLDRLEIAARRGELRLSSAAALRPVIAVLALGAGLWWLGAPPLLVSAAMAFSGSAFAWLAARDLFDAWRVIRLIPETTILTVVALGLARSALARTGLLDLPSGRVLATASLLAAVFRLALLSQPDYYYPDLMTHARVAEAMSEEGLSFFLNPAAALAAQGAWTKPVMGSTTSLPYAVGFHAPFALLRGALHWTLDDVETAMKVVGSVVSVLPILLGGALAAQLGAPATAGVFLALIPVYVSRLGYALLPALFGHAMDLVVMLALARLMSRPVLSLKGREAGVLIALLAAGHLSYTSSLMNEGMLMATLVVLLLVARRSVDAARVVSIEALAVLLSVALYYRSFLGDLSSVIGRLGGAASGPSQYAVEGFFALLAERLAAYFGPVWLGFAVLGAILTPEGRSIGRALITRAWGLAFLLLILLRAKVPDIFRYGHETLFITPLIVLSAGTALAAAWRRGGGVRLAALFAGGVLVIGSVAGHVAALSEHLANAR